MALEYYFIFFITVLFSLNYEYDVNTAIQKKGSNVLHFIFFCILIFFIGFRFEVGGDWSSYNFYYQRAANTPFLNYISLNEFSYALINYFSSKISGGILLVNIICAFIFTYFLYNFLLQLPRPWLGLLIAIPYFIIVISMGFVRQGLAIAIFMYAITYIRKQKYVKFLFWIFIASTFHISALAFMPLVLFQYLQKKIISLFLILVPLFGIFYLNYQLIISKFENYFLSEMVSDGAFIRSIMNLIPAVIFIIFIKKFKISKSEKYFWTQISFVSILFSVILTLYPNYTIIDRIGYYLIALQIFVFTFLPSVFGNPFKKNKFWVISVISYYFLVLFVWQNFADHNYAWIPYKSYIFNLYW